MISHITVCIGLYVSFDKLFYKFLEESVCSLYEETKAPLGIILRAFSSKDFTDNPDFFCFALEILEIF